MKNKQSRLWILFAVSLCAGFLIVWYHLFGMSFGGGAEDTTIPIESFQCSGYDVNGGGYTSTNEDPQMQVTLNDTAYRYIDIYLDNLQNRNDLKLQVFYTEDGTYTEENSVVTVVKTGRNRIQLPKNVKLRGVRIDIGTSSGVSFALKQVVCSNKIEVTSSFWICLILLEAVIILCWYAYTRKKYAVIYAYIVAHKWETIIVCAAFVMYFMWSLILPYNSGPDEYMRFQIPEYIYANHALPRGDDPWLCNNVWGLSYAFQPYLAYLVSVFFMFVGGTFDLSPYAIFHVARMSSVMFSTITVVYCIKIAKQIFNQKTGRLFVVMVAFLPQFVFISSYVNNDSLAIMASAMVVYYWIRGLKTIWDKSAYIGLGIALAICIASYRNVYGYGLCSAAIFIFSYIRQYKKTKDKALFAELIKKGLIICGIAVLISGWWYVRNYIIYDGDIMGKSFSKLAKMKYAAAQYKPDVRTTLAKSGVSLKAMLFDMGWLKGTARSFVAGFGYMELWLPNWCYVVYFLVFCGGLTGYVITLKKKAKPVFDKLLHVFLWLSIGIVLCLSIYYSYFMDYQPQGRYLLPIIVPLMMLFSTGIYKLEQVLQKKTGHKIAVIPVVIMIILAICVVSLVYTIIPYYYWTGNAIPESFWQYGYY